MDQTIPNSGLHQLKITVVGDSTVGKTSFVYAITSDTFQEYYPDFSPYNHNVNVDGHDISINFWDTAGYADYDKLRPLSYPKTDCFILCYAINNHTSFASIEDKWIPELKMYCPETPIILLGTKSDLKDEDDIISEKEGQTLMKKIKTNSFRECSAKTREGLNDVVVDAVRAIMVEKRRGEKSCSCKLL